MRAVACILLCVACASHARRADQRQYNSKKENRAIAADVSSLKSLATLLQAAEPPTGAFFGAVAGKNVVVAGSCTQTGQFIARQLSDSFRVTALCRPSTAEKVKDDDSTLAEARLNFVDVGASVNTDAVVIASDEAPSPETMSSFMKTCSDAGVPHVVLLSRIGASRGGFGASGDWKKAEETALETFGQKGLTILRVGEPLLGGPFYKKEVDTMKWSSAKAVDGYSTLTVAVGDELKQQGLGSSRAAATKAISSVLRRGPEEEAVFSVVGDTTKTEGEQTTQAQLDAMFEEAGGKPSSTGGGSASLRVDMQDPNLRLLIAKSFPKPPGIKDLLFGPPAVSGGYWGTIFLFIYGTYLTTTPEYIAKSGVDLWSR